MSSSNSEEIRSLPLTPELKIRLANFVLLHKNVLFARHNSNIRQVDKNKLWRQIHAELTAHGAVLKDAAYVRDRAWDNLKSTAIKKKKKLGSTGAGGESYTEVERITLDIIDPQSAYLAGINDTDSAPQFSGATPIGGAQGGLDFNDTIQSIDSTFSINPGTSHTFTVPRPIRTSSPVGLEETTRSSTQTGATVKRKRGGSSQALWTTEAYKELKVQQIELDMEEKRVHIELMKQQIQESKDRADFFKRAGLAIQNRHSLQIGDINIQL